MERTRRRARPALAALALAAPVALAAGPAAAAPDPLVYDALGDSYAAGFGLAPGQSHPHVLDGRMRIELDDLAAVPTGGTVQHLVDEQLAVLRPDTELVTVSAGGNDIPWTDVVVACAVFGDEACASALGLAHAKMGAVIPGALDGAYTGIRAAAPGAHVVVTGYPRLFSPEYGDYTGVADIPGLGQIPFEVTVAEQQAMNDLADALNATIAEQAAVHGFQFVDVTGRFEGHGVNAPDAWIGGVGHPALLHPTAKGQHTYGVALRAAINARDLR